MKQKRLLGIDLNKRNSLERENPPLTIYPTLLEDTGGKTMNEVLYIPNLTLFGI